MLFYSSRMLRRLAEVFKVLMAHVNVMKAASAERNADPILNALVSVLPKEGSVRVLEIASGTGQHHVHFASRMPHTVWQPSECDDSSMKSICGYQALNPSLKNILPPVFVDCSKSVTDWAEGTLTPKGFDAILCVNMIHITPWVCTEGLFAGAAYYIRPGGLLITYGAYKIHGNLVPESNARFDESLRSRNPHWGVRDIDDLQILAEKNGFKFDRMLDMPANNKVLVYTKL